MTGQPCPPLLRTQFRGRQPRALQTDCPHCDATAGQPCHGPSGRRLHQAHASRYEAAGLRAGIVTDPEQRRAS